MKVCKKFYSQIPLLIISLILGGSCSDDNGIDKKVKEINRFVYQEMKNYYLWNNRLPDLNPNEQPDTKVFFKSLLYEGVDKWSFITDDVDALNNYFAGVRKEFGYSFRFFSLKKGRDRLVAVVEYVEPNGPAFKAGLKRGDVIVKVDGEEITSVNYGKLFNSEMITVGLGLVSDGVVKDLTSTLKLVSEEIHVNPILKTEVFHVGDVKIGYLAYTSFIHEYNGKLEGVFADFKANSISELILDLRYNGGGSVSTARLMASMICPASCVGKLFLRTAYNNGLEAAIRRENPSDYKEWFEDYFETNDNNLDLNNLYVLTTPGTASASEMVIYSLSPYMNVVQIGEQTHGKYYGSITIDDEDKKHKWAIQPIIMRAENVDNSIDYNVGLQPKFTIKDDYSYELGTKEDLLTAAAIQQITGVKPSQRGLKSADILGFTNADELLNKGNPLKYEMYIDKK